VLAIYLLTLGVSAGIVGVFFRTLLADAGYIPEFQAGVAIACGAASAYVACQLLFMTVVRFIWPTRSHMPILADCASHVSAVILLMPLMGVEVDWPHPMLEKVAPLIFFGLFAGAHALLKLLSFYAVLQAEPGKRLGSIFWAVSVVVFCIGAYIPFTWWLESLRGFQPQVSANVETYEFEGAYASARAVPEGALVETEASGVENGGITFRWSPVPDEVSDDPFPGVFASITMHGDESATYNAWVPFEEDGWAVLQVPPAEVPAGLTRCGVFWYEQQEPQWRSLLGIRPIIADGRKVMVSGPFIHAAAASAEPGPNFVVLIVDGLGTDRVSEFGGKDDSTPFLDHFSQSSVVFPNAYTPAPFPEAAVMTLLTGVSPLRHGYLGERTGPLPEAYPTLAEALGKVGYATAAFTEGEARPGFAYGSGFERGFEHYDVAYTTEESGLVDDAVEIPETRSARTLERALRWIGRNQQTRFAVVVYLSELRDMTYRERYGILPSAGAREPSTDAIYNAGLRYLDEEIGEFIRGIRGLESGENTCVVVTSTQGSDFSPPPKLTESVLCVPIWIEAPGVDPVVRRDLATLGQVAPTLAGMAGVELADNRSLITNPVTVEPISMAGEPLVLTIRNDRWRMYWSSQRNPFSVTRTTDPPNASLYDLTRLRTGQTLQDVAAQNREMVERWTNRLLSFLENESAIWR
jgi:arylsulfatase A-like enzyme